MKYDGNVEDLDLTFSIDTDVFGKVRSYQICFLFCFLPYMYSQGQLFLQFMRHILAYFCKYRPIFILSSKISRIFLQLDTIDLLPGGGAIPVTNENRILYAYLVADYRLNRQTAKQNKYAYMQYMVHNLLVYALCYRFFIFWWILLDAYDYSRCVV